MTVAGKTLGQMLDAVEPVENDVIRTMEHPQKPEGGIAVLCGSLAPDGAVVKQSGVKPSMYRFSGRARVFNSMEEADAAVSAGTIEKGTVLVIRYEGPKGGPGMREMLSTTGVWTRTAPWSPTGASPAPRMAPASGISPRRRPLAAPSPWWRTAMKFSLTSRPAALS